jgi:anti-sigma factor RsiW
VFTDAELLAYLDESAPAERMAAIERALRDDAALGERVGRLVAGRDAGLHSLGEVWRRRRLTCATREELGSLLLGVLDPQRDAYLRFHVETVGCAWCAASLADLRDRHAASDAPAAQARQRRYFQSSVGRLTPKGEAPMTKH